MAGNMVLVTSSTTIKRRYENLAKTKGKLPLIPPGYIGAGREEGTATGVDVTPYDKEGSKAEQLF